MDVVHWLVTSQHVAIVYNIAVLPFQMFLFKLLPQPFIQPLQCLAHLWMQVGLSVCLQMSMQINVMGAS